MTGVYDLDEFTSVRDLGIYEEPEDVFRFLKQGYYCLGDDVPAYDYDDYGFDEEQMLCDWYGEYYWEGIYLQEGFTREDLLEWMEYDASFYGFDFQSGYGSGYYEVIDDVGKKMPEHSISKPVTIGRQEGPKCSAYASSSLLSFYDKEVKPKKLYKRFHKLPDGSAIPSSVGKVIRAKCHTHGCISDLEKAVDADKPVMILAYYDKSPEWNNLHYMLVTGYDDKHIYIADSLHSSGERYYNRKVDRKTFMKMWNTSKSFLVRLFYGKNIWYEYNP